MRDCITERRVRRIEEVLSRRQTDLTLVINNIHDPHNVSAILRSCDAFGIHRVHLLYTDTAFPALGKKSSGSAKKWVETVRHKDAASLAAALKGQGFRLVATSFTETAVPLQKWDLTTKTAIILGNEHSGVDEDLAPHVDGALYIPMMGMVQSLNVSVAAAVILYEGFRQLEAAGRYDAPCIESEEMARLVKLWCSK
ncbi:MAG TPA: RNA methyltransferase [Solidesulfovibrio magneticus]|jgi:tRNA (guanosine-2'-O-)-methyltransferase|nr:RNA methyltransferase [Solidesulfovibrio magneticus]